MKTLAADRRLSCLTRRKVQAVAPFQPAVADVIGVDPSFLLFFFGGGCARLVDIQTTSDHFSREHPPNNGTGLLIWGVLLCTDMNRNT